MSKAFTREDERGEPLVIPARAPLPEGVPNYVTPRGLQRLRDELTMLEGERATLGTASEEVEGNGDRTRKLEFLEGRMAALAARIGSALLVDGPPGDGLDEARFGVTATVRSADGTGGVQRFTIVGVDEADAAAGRVAFVAPIARALLGRRVGDVITVARRGGEEELAIVALAYES